MQLIGTRPSAIASSRRRPPRLLVVDDEPDASEAMRVLLEMDGYDVTTTRTAREALAGVVTESYDLVLADIAMPGTDGITLCQEVAGLRPTLPVMLVTGRSDTATLTRALRAGARDFLHETARPRRIAQRRRPPTGPSIGENGPVGLVRGRPRQAIRVGRCLSRR